MIGKFVFLTLIGLRLWTAPHIPPAFGSAQAKADLPLVHKIDARWSDHRITLNWTVEHNEQAYLFQVEKSSNGRRFTKVALVLGTDKYHTEQYSFFEPARDEKVYYRLLLTDKSNQTIRTRPIEIRKNTSTSLTISNHE